MDSAVKIPSADKLEAMEQQRRASMQTRRASLAECISDWPTLMKRKVVVQVTPIVIAHILTPQDNSLTHSLQPFTLGNNNKCMYDVLTNQNH